MDQTRRAQLAEEFCRLRGLDGIVVGQAGVERLAGAHGVGQGAHGLLERRVRVGAMAVEDVNVLEAEAAQALIEARQQVFS